MQKKQAVWFGFCLVGWVCLASPTYSQQTTLPPPNKEKVDFQKDIFPLLKDRCFRCHKGTEASSGYRLDLRAELLGETNGKPLVKIGKSADSRLIHLVAGMVPDKKMPKTGKPLTKNEIGLLRAWIDQGLAWDESLLPTTVEADHWSFRPVAFQAPPKVKNPQWVRNPIDAFIAAKHAEKGLTPAPEAPRRVLIRRLHLDLIGLLPTPEEITAFVEDESPDAYEKLVDRLLASPHYGERWARHWLDVARWAESEGYESNHTRPFAWRYRDYVVNSFNQDKPYPQFIREQIAGDELTPYKDENLIATGFLAAARLSSNEEDKWLQRNDVLVDVVNATSSTFLGLTMNCAQCHNHKFDPITSRDYYRFRGFFLKGQPANLEIRNADLWAKYNAKKPAEYDALVKEKWALFEEGRQRLIEQVRKKLSPKQLRALDIPSNKRTDEEERIVREVHLKFQYTPNKIERAISPEDRKHYNALKKKIADMEKTMPPRPQTFGYYSPITSSHKIPVLPMKGFYPLPYEPEELALAEPYLLVGGDVHNRGFKVDVGWPEVFGPVPKKKVQAHPRTELANWLGSPQNPLTARVYVNRLWQYHFGRGIVATPGDFGRKGAPPSHPKLLDWLAWEFMQKGWSTKHIHRLIVTSNTYRQSSQPNADYQEKDEDNQYLWHWKPRRLEAEIVRDIILSVSAELNPKMGGPSDPANDDSFRRTLYLFQERDHPTPIASVFDGPSACLECCNKRHVSTVPLQSLFLLNSDYPFARAKAFAQRVIEETGPDRTKQIDRACLVALGRSLNDRERKAVNQFFDQLEQNGEKDALVNLTHFCQVLMNANEFIYIE